MINQLTLGSCVSVVESCHPPPPPLKVHAIANILPKLLLNSPGRSFKIFPRITHSSFFSQGELAAPQTSLANLAFPKEKLKWRNEMKWNCMATPCLSYVIIWVGLHLKGIYPNYSKSVSSVFSWQERFYVFSLHVW